MISQRAFPIMQGYWSLFDDKGRKDWPDGKLLLALAWCLTGFDAKAITTDGGAGLLLMKPDIAEAVAAKLKVKSWTLTDPKTAVRFAAWWLSRLIDRFGLPRLGVAAYLAGAEAVKAAGGKVPHDPEVARMVRDVMAIWRWLVRNWNEIVELEQPSAKKPEQPHITTTASDSWVTLSTTATITSTSTANPTTIIHPPTWRLVTLPARYPGPLVVDSHVLLTLEELAARLGLSFLRDDVEHTVYLGLGKPIPDTTQRLIVPIPGATAANNGWYSGAPGLDIMTPLGTPVMAAAAGRLLFPPPDEPPDEPPSSEVASAVIILDKPLTFRGKRFHFIGYRYLSRLHSALCAKSDDQTIGPRVEQGQVIGWSGMADRVPYLRFTVSLDADENMRLDPITIASHFGWLSGGAL